MSAKTRGIIGIVFILLILVVGYVCGQSARTEAASVAAIDQCAYEAAHPIDCWLSLLRDQFDEGGIEAAFSTFEKIYQRHELFANSGCHVYAHRIGDMAYYYEYLQHRDLDKINFPKNANACGYGFYHGFIEHLIQDNPDPVYVTKTCTKLKTRLSDIAPAIGSTCYHGAGHGFVLAKADEALDPLKWSFNFFTDEAAKKCTNLPAASEHEISECRQGVYTIITGWMEDKEYGFEYPSTAPFMYCDTQTEVEYRKDCYQEMAQKISGGIDRKVQKAMDLILTGLHEEYYLDTLSIAVSGMVQSDPDGSGVRLLEECRQLSESFQATCLRAIVGGQFEHGVPDAEYDIAQRFCADTPMTDEERSFCLDRFTQKLYRFRTPEEVQTFCNTDVLNETVCEYLASEW